MSTGDAVAARADVTRVRATILIAEGHLYTERRGNGDAIICIAGAGGDAAMFQHLARELSGTHSVVTYDRRGNSRSRCPQQDVSVAEHADDVVRIMDAFKIDRAYLFAQSLGCAIALNCSLRHPDRLSGAILHEPFWFPTFVRDPAGLGAHIASRSNEIQSRLGPACGDLEARIRYFGGESFVASLGAIAAQRVFSNGKVSSNERTVFSRWLPSAREFNVLQRAPIELMVGADTHSFFSDVVRAFEVALDRQAVVVAGGHGGFSDRSEDAAAQVRDVLSRFACAEASSIKSECMSPSRNVHA